MGRFITFISIFCAITLVLVALFGILFRLIIYPDLPVNPGEPYGIADILELIIFVTIMGMAILSMVLGIVLLSIPAWRNIRLAIVTLILSLVVPPVYYMLHSLTIGLV